MKWQNKLTKKELKHFKEDAGCRTLTQFRNSRLAQIKHEIHCFECERISKKLAIEETIEWAKKKEEV